MPSTPYLASEFAETDGDAIDVFSGYAYDKPELANDHASRVWGGSVRSCEVLSEVPAWVLGLDRREP